MTEKKVQKRGFVLISSDEDEEQHFEDDDNSVDFNELDCEDVDESAEEITDSSSCENDENGSDNQGYAEDESSSFDNDDDDGIDVCNGEDKEEAICDRVVRLLREGSQLQDLNLIECKTYLRKLGLRLSGTKGECIERIKEYWRVKDGNGEAHYPRSSFNIDCTGDVCKGDVVLFTQKVYQKFEKMTRSGKILGKRIIAGRIVKESYGAAKQQHTFTVEVLWTKGVKKLPPLFPLLVKGRNLYKLKTFRQIWRNESERLIVLAEKHKRGTAARNVRAMKKSKKINRTNAGGTRQKTFHHESSQMNRYIKADKGKGVLRQKQAPQKNVRPGDHHKRSLAATRVKSKQSTKSRGCNSYSRRQTFNHPHEVRHPTSSSQDFYHSQIKFEHQRAPLNYTFGRDSTSSMRPPHLTPYFDYYTRHASEPQGLNHGNYSHFAYSNPIHEPREGNFNGLHILTETYRPLHPFPYRTDTYGQRRRRDFEVFSALP